MSCVKGHDVSTVSPINPSITVVVMPSTNTRFDVDKRTFFCELNKSNALDLEHQQKQGSTIP